MNKKKYTILSFFLSLTTIISFGQQQFKKSLHQSFKEANVITNGHTLTVSTGKYTRVWKLTPKGLLSQRINGFNGIMNPIESVYNSDWNLEGILNPKLNGELISLTAHKANDEGFTSDHLKVTAEFEYKTQGLVLKYDIWAYPNATGIRTQIHLKKLANYSPPQTSETLARAEYFPIKTNDVETKLIGYYNDTQHRNKRETEILKEVTTTEKGDYNWASIIDIQSKDQGLMLVQESHKCVNQPGVHTGSFHVDETGLYASGLGISFENLSEEFQPLWAYWSVTYHGNEEERALALKQFDRLRYPIDPKRDIYIMANNWGSGASGDESRHASREENILLEIASQKDLGIDLQQVDDGWQGYHQYKKWDLVSQTTSKQFGTYDVYPEGWKNIRLAAKKSNIKLGLWAAWTIPGEDLLKQYHNGGFSSYKLDFANLKNYKTFHNFINKVRTFILATDHNVRVNWDVTENPARIGYFYGREYGNIYLENRKPINPINVLYHPYLVLRDAWQVSKYTNLNKFQVSIQNIDRVNKAASDAYLHNHAYSVAISLMGSPIFFQETRYYSEAARNEIKPLLDVYKKHRKAMYKGYVFPIGAKPDNNSWTGFQNYNPSSKVGYLTVFREINNKEIHQKITLRFLKNKEIKLTNLMTGEITQTAIDKKGNLNLSIENPIDFRFFKYEVL